MSLRLLPAYESQLTQTWITFYALYPLFLYLTLSPSLSLLVCVFLSLLLPAGFVPFCRFWLGKSAENLRKLRA